LGESGPPWHGWRGMELRLAERAQPKNCSIADA
jgi:hypothetical protein